MSNSDDTIGMTTPPMSSSADNQLQDTLLKCGAFDPPFTLGTLGRLERFEILRLLGEGGMGLVYLAREPVTGVRVAIKIMKPQLADDPHSVHRFLIEARHMYGMSQPNILRVLEVSDRKEGPYYVMPYVDGGSLLTLTKPGQSLTEQQLLPIAQQIAGALNYAHTRGIIHRDLKPGNVLLDKDGQAFLSDFGLVRTVFNDSMIDVSCCHIEGTVPYMSPAVALGEAEDTRCDIYAFGALLYELLTGQPPYIGRTPHMILEQILKGPPAPIRTVNPNASPSLVKIAEGCMARELHDRYANMADVVSDLDLATKGAIPLGPHQQAQRRRMPRIAAILAGTFAVAALAGAAIYHYASGAIAPKSIPAGTDQYPFTYTTNNGAITITKYTGPGGAVVIPNKINGLPVTDIGYATFVFRRDITNVTIPNGVNNIWDYAFMETRLTKVIIPKSVTFMSSNPFGCTKELISISVDAANPRYCSSVDGVVFNKEKTCLVSYPAGKAGGYMIPAGITDIGNLAFNNCTRLTSIVIPHSVTRIGDSAFVGCIGLTNVTISEHVTSMGDRAFGSCSGLISISVDVANPAYCTGEDGVVFDKQKTHLVICPAGKTGDYVVPKGVDKIRQRAFDGCANLIRVTIPEDVTSLEGWTFAGCINLTGIYFQGDAPCFDREVFDGSKKVTAYYCLGTKGWGPTFGGRPTAVWKQ